MKDKRGLLFVFPILALLVSCATGNIQLAEVTITPSVTREVEISPALTLDLPTSTILPTATSSEFTIIESLPPGLMIVRGGENGGQTLEFVRSDGGLELLARGLNLPEVSSDLDVSPDGSHVLYSDQGDIWLLDIATKEAVNITNTPDSYERVPRWWPGHSDGFICGVYPGSSPIPPLLGYLTFVSLDGQQDVLDGDAHLASAPAPSPNGQTIAYTRVRTDPDDHAPNLWIYSKDQKPERVDLSTYSLGDVQTIGDVSWSTDSSQLGIALYGVIGSRQQMAIATLLLDSTDSEVLLTFEGLAIEAALENNAPQWAPDGMWLVFLARAENVSEVGIWLADGQSVQRVSPAFAEKPHQRPDLPHWVGKPAISPDGQWVAVWTTTGDIGLLRAGEWEPLLFQTVSHVIGVDWIVE